MTAAMVSPSNRDRLALLLASVGGVGYCPVAPATAGSAVALGIYLVMPSTATAQFGILLFVLLIALWASGRVAVRGGKDPSYVVIDEVAGMLVACFLLPKTPGVLAAAFVLFRILDIGKWFPMKQLERLPGGWGIVADDLAAGLLARLLLALWR